MLGKLRPSPKKTISTNKKIKLSEVHYRRLFEAAQDGILILDANTGKITDANPFLKNLLGYSKAELLGKQLWQIGVFKDIVDSKKAFKELQTNGYIRYKDLPLKTKDGQSIAVEFVSNVYEAEGERIIQCNIRDITNRKRTESVVTARAKELEIMIASQEKTKKAMLNIMEDLREAKTVIEIEKVKDEAVLASIGDGLIAIDNNRRIMTINKVAETMFGVKGGDVVGQEITTIPLEDEAGNVLPLNKRPAYIALNTGESVSAHYYYTDPDQARVPIAINVTPIKLAGKIIGALDVFRDITRENEIDKAKSEFVSLASHQLRTPLGIIKWYLEALGKDSYLRQAPATFQQYFEEIRKSNERVLSLVRDLLSVSRIEQGRVENTPKSIEPSLVMNEVVTQMQIIALEKKVKLRLIIKDEQLPPIIIDTLRFNEVVENLVSNAIEYSVAGGVVEVSSYKEDNNLIVNVVDTGIGILAADQKKLFTKFFRAATAIGHNPEGSGLGLYVAQAYVEGWGGTITVKSAVGKGSTFTVSLPLYGVKVANVEKARVSKRR